MSYVFARNTCAVAWQGRTVRLRQGEVWHASDPFVKAHPHQFAKDPTVVRGRGGASEPPVEQATAAPGEKRTTSRKKDSETSS